MTIGVERRSTPEYSAHRQLVGKYCIQVQSLLHYQVQDYGQLLCHIPCIPHVHKSLLSLTRPYPLQLCNKGNVKEGAGA